MSILKKILLFTLFFFIGILVAQKSIIPHYPELFSKGYVEDYFQNTLNTDTVEIQEVKEDAITVRTVEGINVPKYWKYGLNTEHTDYLLGYLPNIRNFREYWNMYNNLQYGIKPVYNPYLTDEIYNHFINSNQYYVTEGIENESEYFQWDIANCSIFHSETLMSEIYICNNWINWIEVGIEQKAYSLVECSLNKVKGFCLFEDYAKLYYDSNRYGESRCFGDNDYFCEFSEYIKLISIN